MPVKLTIIRDPIHNYIPISHLEKALIDHPLFQRLRHITQNGLAHSVYPSNRTSRFLHSLGTMHVGGQMFRYATANTPEETLEDLYQTADQLVRAEAGKVYSTSESSPITFGGSTTPSTASSALVAAAQATS